MVVARRCRRVFHSSSHSFHIRGPQITPADSSSFFSANHSPLSGFQALVDAALENLASLLFNAL